MAARRARAAHGSTTYCATACPASSARMPAPTRRVSLTLSHTGRKSTAARPGLSSTMPATCAASAATSRASAMARAANICVLSIDGCWFTSRDSRDSRFRWLDVSSAWCDSFAIRRRDSISDHAGCSSGFLSGPSGRPGSRSTPIRRPSGTHSRSGGCRSSFSIPGRLSNGRPPPVGNRPYARKSPPELPIRPKPLLSVLSIWSSGGDSL
ncbi:hypothetical protein CDD83_655 [Cordyceps sp. RAO-2017]|nr:hypothetical protein CDD83_655 [Cordyceps sp. RAO-2017]